MNILTQAFDSSSMPLSEPSTAPSAFSLWRWLGERATAKVSAQQQAETLRDHAHGLSMDPLLRTSCAPRPICSKNGAAETRFDAPRAAHRAARCFWGAPPW